MSVSKHENKLKQHAQYILTPGYIAVSTKPALLCSVCANGLVVVLWDRLIRIGGMSHCIYSEVGRDMSKMNCYADKAIPQLVKKMVDNKGYHLVAQLFGTASYTGRVSSRTRKMVLITKRLLKKFDIDVISEDIGGRLARKVIFDTYSGDVLVLKTKNVRRNDWLIE